MRKRILDRLGGGGYFYKQLNKDVKEINKVFLSLFSTGIILIAIFVGINITKNSYALFTDTIKGEKTIEVVVDNLLNKTIVFTYTGDSQEYEVPKDGYYYIEMAGGQGGTNDTYLSLGAKTSGYIYLEKGEILYFYVGKSGTAHDTNCRTSGYEFNGGGIAKPASSGVCGATGGGATDVRLTGGNWDNTSSLISRIMVAAGAGGYVTSNQYTQGSGGTLYGVKSIYSTYQTYIGNAGTQTAGGAAPTKFSSAQSNGTAGSFGKGGYGGASSTSAKNGGGGGGGSGYYGGSGSSGIANGTFPGNGGSSYISGYAGVNSIEESTTITHTNQTIHYSGKYFIGGKMYEGQNEGNGYAKITYVREKPKKKTTKLDNVRYIKNCVNYNTYNNYNHWLEVQAIKDGINIAKGKSVTGTTSASSSYPYSRITDGDITYVNYAQSSSQTNNQCITVDLGDTYDLDEIAVWNHFGDQRSYYDNITSVSSDNSSWIEVIDEAMLETSNGHRINAYTDIYNGYVQDGLVLWYDGYSNTGTTRNHTTTTWKDLSGTGNNGTVSGATWYYNYLSFDGTNDYAYKTSGAIYNISKEHTIEILLKPETLSPTYQAVFSTYPDGSGIYQYGSLWIYNSSQSIFYEVGDGLSSNKRFGLKLSNEDLGKYLLMTNVRNDRNYKVYNKGNLIENVDISFDAIVPNPSINVGGTRSGSYFQGEIYSIRIYNKALTEEEIMNNYNYDIEKFNLD